MLIMKDGKVTRPHLKIASSPSYTLAELKVRAEEYVRRADFITESEALTYELHLSTFLAWLAQREQGKGGIDGEK